MPRHPEVQFPPIHAPWLLRGCRERFGDMVGPEETELIQSDDSDGAVGYT